jgi:hypothetical protein
MPLPMVHLSIAHQLVERYGYPSSPAFYLGSVAPDAIHKRPNTDRGNKLAVHLVGEGGLDEGRLCALLSRRGQGTDDAASIADMAAGYAAHVLTDVYWREDLILPFRARHEERLLRAQMSVDELRALYYAECDKVDLELYDRQPWRPQVWALLRAARARDVDGLLSADEIAGWQDRVLSWFEANRHKAGYTLQYLTLERVLAFIDDTAARVHERLAAQMSPHPALKGWHTSGSS